MAEKEDLDPRFMELASRFLDGAATAEELESLDGIVRNDPRALDTLGELLNQHGTLAWTQRGQASFKGETSPLTFPGTAKGPDPSPRRAWWIAIPLAACLLLTLVIIRYAPRGVVSTPKIVPPEPPVAAPEWLTLSFQDGVSPLKDYRGTRDTMLVERETSKKPGSEPLLEVDGESGGRPALLQWDLREIPPGSRLVSASLTLTVTSITGDREYEAYAVFRPWVESQANRIEYSSNRRWEVPGGKGSQDRGSRVLARFKPMRGAVALPLNEAGLAAVQRWVNSADSNHGLLLETTDRAGEFSFHSRESEIASYRPRLTVSYRPPTK
jgi:hypothetical protein